MGMLCLPFWEHLISFKAFQNQKKNKREWPEVYGCSIKRNMSHYKYEIASVLHMKTILYPWSPHGHFLIASLLSEPLSCLTLPSCFRWPVFNRLKDQIWDFPCLGGLCSGLERRLSGWRFSVHLNRIPRSSPWEENQLLQVVLRLLRKHSTRVFPHTHHTHTHTHTHNRNEKSKSNSNFYHDSLFQTSIAVHKNFDFIAWC